MDKWKQCRTLLPPREHQEAAGENSNIKQVILEVGELYQFSKLQIGHKIEDEDNAEH